MPKVSVIIPAYNASGFLPLTLRYALDSTYRDMEIVVVDDGSVDDTEAVVKQFGGPVRYVRQANQGAPAARNTGLRMADSDYIAFLDSDDLWHPEKLAVQVGLLESRPEFGLVYGEFKTWDGSLPVPAFSPGLSSELVPHLSGWIYHKMLLTNWPLPSTWLTRRSLVDKNGFFNTETKVTDDWEYAIRASRLTQFAKLKAVVALYRQNPAQLSKSLFQCNYPEALREKMLAEFGESGPDGATVDRVELRRRQHQGYLGYGLEHLVRGDIRSGFSQVRRSLAYRRDMMLTTVSVGKALIRRFLR